MLNSSSALGLGAETRGKTFRWLLDTAVLLAVIAGASLLLDRNPVGWIATNPSPFLLVPALIGGRYGVLAGLTAGLAATLPLIFRSQYEIFETLTVWTYTLVSMPVSGLVCGEIHRLVTRNMRRDQLELRHARLRLRALDQQIHLLTEVKDELDRELALTNSDIATLDFEIRRVLQAPPDRFNESLLGLVTRKGKLEEAAIYDLQADGTWKRKAVQGTWDSWPEILDPDSSVVARAALKSGIMATLPGIWNSSIPLPPSEPLLVCPLGAEFSPNGLLLVRSMPFHSFNRRTLRTLEVICRWVSEFTALEQRKDGLFDQRGRLSAEDFKQMVNLACLAEKELRISSSVILMHSGNSRPVSAEELFSSVRGAMRVGDVVMTTDSPHPCLLLLLPLTGRRGAEICVARFRDFATDPTRGSLILTGDILTTSEFSDEATLFEKVASILR